MLKQRLLTAAILIPLVIASILYLPTSIMQWILAGVVVLAAFEWFTMIGFNTRSKTLFALVALLFTTVIVSLLPVHILLLFAAMVWGIILLFISYFANRVLPEKIQQLFIHPVIALMLASLVLAIFWHTTVQLHQSSALGPQQFFYVIILVWLADSGGYFAGKRWGKTPLATAISPNKTWQGVAGALTLGIVWAIVAYYLDIAGSLGFISWLLLSIDALLISIVGDLFESVFKRCHQVKDSGNLLPGHGGMLDRIDSLIAAVPVFSAGVYFLGAG